MRLTKNESVNCHGAKYCPDHPDYLGLSMELYYILDLT